VKNRHQAVTLGSALAGQHVVVVRSAPRYDARIDALVIELDDPSESMAEICRRVSAAAERLGLTRPSLVHLRTLVRDERDRKAAERARREDRDRLLEEVATDVLAGRMPDPYALERRHQR
jgi:hypothetical protein